MVTRDHQQEVLLSIEDIAATEATTPPVPPLELDETHIWELSLTNAIPDLGAYARLLSADESLRAKRFRFEKDSRRFTITRGFLRSILGSYTITPAPDLQFRYSEYDKPSLDKPASGVRFSVSHSGDLALFAVAAGREVGVDVEVMKSDIETDKLAQRFFSARERQALMALPYHMRTRSFYRCWTCKEAFLKADGRGLSRALDSFDVEVNPRCEARLLSTRPDANEAHSWSLYDVPTEQGYAAALATEGSIQRIRVLRCR